ncbi:tetratricopeptide repeat protein [Acetobacter suratthaniensis]|uniref:Sel1 repeat family protein n=1 Tax=Acetobacter suratthaniensis TaxID=1502841 RepID=A0ABS3LKL9_9PROT|nr:tetratricopeptide repeat protein [Acetobacter suratthaniensis]MBO1328090.1 sel1 repeat family protein [Acetobacter suratthaniensis]MCX2566070.1 tetratricopeptide repeat protein [Acetobacter suratthaniensis]
MSTSEEQAALLALVTQQARAGDAQAQLALGQLLLNGIGTARDEKNAFRWFLASALQGVAMGCNMVGRCRELGWGVALNKAEAMPWYRRAAQAGLDWGMYNYATGLTLGWGGPRDLEAALLWFRRSAALGHCKSFNIIGSFYEDGWACARDLRRARAWYAAAARCGDFRGHFNYGRFLLRENQPGDAAQHFAIARQLGTAAFVEKMDAFLLNADRPDLLAQRPFPVGGMGEGASSPLTVL